MELLFLLLGLAALMSFFDMSPALADGITEPDEDPAPDSPGNGDLIDDGGDNSGGGADPEPDPEPDPDPAPLVGVSIVNGEALPGRIGVALSDSDPGAMVLAGGTLSAADLGIDGDDIFLRRLDLGGVAGDFGVHVNAAGDVSVHHADSAAPLVIEGAPFHRIETGFTLVEGRSILIDLRDADETVQVALSRSGDYAVLTGDAPGWISTTGNTQVVFGSGGGSFTTAQFTHDGPNNVITGSGVHYLSITPGDTVTANEGMRGLIELRPLHGDPDAGPAIIRGFDPLGTYLLVHEQLTRPAGGPMPVAQPVTLSDSAQGVQVHHGTRLVALLEDLTLADNPQVQLTTDRYDLWRESFWNDWQRGIGRA